MASCKKCGGGRAVTPVSPSAAQELRASGDMVMIDYIGIQEQKQRLRSKVSPHEQYVFGGGQTQFWAYRGDVEWLTSLTKQFKVSETPVVVTESGIVEVPVLTSATKAPEQTDLPIEVLQLDPITIGLLKRKFNTVNELRNAGRAEWMLIKGIGAVRADEIKEALDVIPA